MSKEKWCMLKYASRYNTLLSTADTLVSLHNPFGILSRDNEDYRKNKVQVQNRDRSNDIRYAFHESYSAII